MGEWILPKVKSFMQGCEYNGSFHTKDAASGLSFQYDGCKQTREHSE